MSRRYPRRQAVLAAGPVLYKGVGYPEERSFRVAEGKLTKCFPEVFTQPVIEIGFITAGTGELYCNGNSYPLRTGDAYFLDMCLPHRHDPAPVLKNRYVHVQYDTLESLAPHDEFPRLLHPFLLLQAGRIGPVIPGAARFGAVIAEALDTYTGTDPYGYTLAWGKVVELFVEIARYCDGNAAPATSRSLSVAKTVTSALHFIHANAFSPVSIRDIALHCAISPSRLCAVFASIMHESPIAYRNRVRLNRAIELLLATGTSVDQIAFECGFHSTAQFRVLIRRYTGKSPRELRSQ